MSSTSHQARFLVPADHPALPGHFPGSPVVPGVVVLDHVLKAGEAWLGRALSARGLKQVKFQSALLPDETADVSLEMKGNSLAFRVTRAGQMIAQGAFVLAGTVAAESVAANAAGADLVGTAPVSAQPSSVNPATSVPTFGGSGSIKTAGVGPGGAEAASDDASTARPVS